MRKYYVCYFINQPQYGGDSVFRGMYDLLSSTTSCVEWNGFKNIFHHTTSLFYILTNMSGFADQLL